MFVRARIDEGVSPNALLVPQRGVTRDPGGHALAFVVSRTNTAEPRTVVADRVVGDAWMITHGLAPGDRVIVEGLQKIRPGGPVAPVPLPAGATLAAAGAPQATPPQPANH
jgi:membrane fusion protein (multidrug efflux system)